MMIALLMRMVPRAGFVWLVLHELRMSLRGSRRRSVTSIFGLILLAAMTAGGVALGYVLRDVPIHRGMMSDIIVLAALAGVMSFMVTQAMIGSQRTLYEVGDLDLLLSAPVPPRTVLAAKLFGIAVAIILTYLTLGLPFLLPIAVMGHPGLLGFAGVAFAAALVAAAVGLALTLTIARIASPRTARTLGQIAAGLVGGIVFLIVQLSNGGDRRRSVYTYLYEQIRKTGIAQTPMGRLPGAAAFGDPVALGILIGGAALIFAIAVWAFQRWFLRGYQAAGTHLSPRRGRATRRGIEPLFKSGLFATVFAKEWRLLARDPALAFQIVLRMIYMAPLLIIALRGNHPFPLAPSLAFFSVAVAGQLAGSFAWLTVAAEDTPDLIKVAPVDKGAIDTAKLMAALTMAAPLAILLPIGIALETVAGAGITLVMTLIAGTLAALLELKMGKPAPRKTFARRRSGSWVVGVLTLLITAVFGGISAVLVFLVGGYSLPTG